MKEIKEIKDMKEKKIKKIVNKKKFLIISAFVVLLLVTGGVNIYLNKVATSQIASGSTITTTGNFFTRYRSDRETTRSEEIMCLDGIINNTLTSAEAKATAEKEKLNLIKKMEMVLEVESVLKAKGFSDVAISALSNNISVMVKCDKLTKNEVAQITDVVLNYTSYTFDNISLIEV